MKLGLIPRDHFIAAVLVFALCSLTLIGLRLHQRAVDSEGEANSSCEQFPLPAMVGPSGWVISGHATGCSPPAASVGYYVYVHPKDQKENIDFMVFRYIDSSKGDDINYKWVDGKTVSISVRSVAEITRLRKSVGPIQIVYDIGSEEYPRSE